MNEDKLFNSYVVYELLYENNIGKKYKDVLLFPNNWYRIINYKVKIDILLEALDKNVLIIETEKYQSLEL